MRNPEGVSIATIEAETWRRGETLMSNVGIYYTNGSSEPLIGLATRKEAPGAGPRQPQMDRAVRLFRESENPLTIITESRYDLMAQVKSAKKGTEAKPEYQNLGDDQIGTLDAYFADRIVELNIEIGQVSERRDYKQRVRQNLPQHPNIFQTVVTLFKHGDVFSDNENTQLDELAHKRNDAIMARADVQEGRIDRVKKCLLETIKLGVGYTGTVLRETSLHIDQELAWKYLQDAYDANSALSTIDPEKALEIKEELNRLFSRLSTTY